MGISVQFEERAVAFIDVLGFKALVENAVKNSKNLEELSGLVDLLSSAVPRLDEEVDNSVPNHLVPHHIYISDCIILSAPLEDQNRRDYDGLSIIIMRVIQISHYLLKAGYLIRGGISVGNVWHTNSNIVGPAYQEALLLDKKGSKPVIALSQSAAKHWRGGSRMCLCDEGIMFVNGLHDFYIPNNTQHGVIEQTYTEYEALANRRLTEQLPDSARNKWAWFKSYLQKEKQEKTK